MKRKESKSRRQSASCSIAWLCREDRRRQATAIRRSRMVYVRTDSEAEIPADRPGMHKELTLHELRPRISRPRWRRGTWRSSSSAHTEPCPEPLLSANALCDTDELFHLGQLDESNLAAVESLSRILRVSLAPLVVLGRRTGRRRVIGCGGRGSGDEWGRLQMVEFEVVEALGYKMRSRLKSGQRKLRRVKMRVELGDKGRGRPNSL